MSFDDKVTHGGACGPSATCHPAVVQNDETLTTTTIPEESPGPRCVSILMHLPDGQDAFSNRRVRYAFKGACAGRSLASLRGSSSPSAAGTVPVGSARCPAESSGRTLEGELTEPTADESAHRAHVAASSDVARLGLRPSSSCATKARQAKAEAHRHRPQAASHADVDDSSRSTAQRRSTGSRSRCGESLLV